MKIDPCILGDSYWKPPFSGAKMLVSGRVIWCQASKSNMTRIQRIAVLQFSKHHETVPIGSMGLAYLPT